MQAGASTIIRRIYRAAEADSRYIDYGNLEYFSGENSMKEHLRKLNEAARNVK